VLVETERLLLQAWQTTKFPAVILRVAGIYGPGRGHLFQQFMKDEARIHGKGDRIINMIHLDDAVGVIMAALRGGQPGEIYNVVDDEPVTQLHFYRWLGEALGKDLPPYATEEENAERKRGLTNKKVANRKLKMELGYQYVHPTFRQGYTAEMLRLEREGKMPV
jgi:nucleoside-diphosphate-sugar epimerase